MAMSQDAEIVHSPVFESRLIKIQNSNEASLSSSEEVTLEKIVANILFIVDEKVVERENFAMSLPKRRKKFQKKKF